MVNLHKICEQSRRWYDLDGSPLEYYKDITPKDHNKEAVLEHLKRLCEIESEDEDDRILWWVHEANPLQNYHGIYYASPVLIALLLKEYEIAEKLMDMGYAANDLLLEEQNYIEISHNMESRHIPIYMSQLLMSQFDIPKPLFERLCETQIAGNFCFVSDYWKNPFLMAEKRDEVKEIYPCMQGFENICNYNRELLGGMLEDMKEVRISGFHDLDMKSWNDLNKQLTEYFWGMTDDIRSLYENMIRYNEEGSTSFDLKLLENGYTCWVRLLPQFMQACEGDRECQKRILNSALHQYYEMDRGYMLNASKIEQFRRELSLFFEEYCPEWYTLDTFIEDIPSMVYWYSVVGMLEVWKTCMHRSMYLRKNNENFYELLFHILGVSEEEWKSESEAVCEDRIAEAIRCLEFAEENCWNGEESRGQEPVDPENTALLFKAVSGRQSEELLLSCIQRGLITEREIPALIRAAFVYGGEKFLPVLMAFRNRKEWEESYVYN